MVGAYIRFSLDEFGRPFRSAREMLDRTALDAVVVFGWSAMGRVVQSNIVTRDETAGAQTGELCPVTSGGLESLHDLPLELLQT